MNKKIIWPILVVLVILAGFFVRVVGLDKSPPSLGFDEAALGYNAYSLMETGKDECGNKLPLTLRSFNDYKPALYAYLIIPFYKIFGVSDQAVRLPSAVAGTVSLIFSFLLLKIFIKNKYLLLGIFILIAFQPWRLHFSRNALETNLSASFFLIATWLLILAKTRFRVLLSVLFLGLSAYSYHSARLAGPALLLLWALDPLSWIKKKKISLKFSRLLYLTLLVVICLPILIANNSQLVLTRFRQENVFNKFYPYAPKELLDINGSMAYFLIGRLVGNVSAYISPINLNNRIFHWVRGSPQYIPGMSMLGWIEGIMVLFGVVYLIKRFENSKPTRIIIYWLVAGIAPAASTWTWFHPFRSLNIFPALEILSGLGIVVSINYIDSKIKTRLLKYGWKFVFSMVLGVSLVFNVNNELRYSPYLNYGEYQPGGFKEGMPYFAGLIKDYHHVIIDSPHAQNYIFFLFYGQIKPELVQSYAYLRPKPGIEGNLNFNFNKYEFRKVDWPVDSKLTNTLFWTRPDITDEEILRVDGAKIEMKVSNILYETAKIITTK
ncbi:MAG: glycosyltransferase family 39 protein [Candidatus Shapirobacteria bacterium]|jgi:4-amino-4-deoxy-L-arabinose transferase-like glycosyltransferase